MMNVRFCMGDQIGPPPPGGYKLMLNSSKNWVQIDVYEWWMLKGPVHRAKRAIEGAETLEEVRIGLEMSGAEKWEGPMP